jgi:hypothetical protein
MSTTPSTANVVALVHLVDVEGNQIHRRVMVRAVPPVTFQKAVDDVLRV